MISYRAGYKYQLHEDALFATGILPGRPLDTQFIRLSTDGTLLIRKGYAWDGASSIAVDDLTIMQASLVHDALYQLMREDALTIDNARRKADKLLRSMIVADGGWRIRAAWVYRAVRWGGLHSSEEGREVLKAP